MATAGKVGGVFASTTDSTSTFTNQATTADTAKLRYSITERSKSAWPPDSAVVVKKNGAAITTGFAIEYASGTVVFDAALTTETVTVGGTYQPVAEVGGFYSWALDANVALIPDTDFIAARAGWATFMSTGVYGGTVTASRYWDMDGFSERVGLPVLVKLYVDVATGGHWVAWALCDKSAESADLGKLVDEPIGFMLVGPICYRDTE
jgi:hypothetical protein